MDDKLLYFLLFSLLTIKVNEPLVEVTEMVRHRGFIGGAIPYHMHSYLGIYIDEKQHNILSMQRVFVMEGIKKRVQS